MFRRIFIIGLACFTSLTAYSASLAPVYANIEARRARQLRECVEQIVSLAAGMQIEIQREDPNYTNIADAIQKVINIGCEIHSSLNRSEQWSSVAEALFGETAIQVALDGSDERAKLLQFAREANAPPAPFQGIYIQPMKLSHEASVSKFDTIAILALVVAVCALILVGIIAYKYFNDSSLRDQILQDLQAAREERKDLTDRLSEHLDCLTEQRNDIDNLILRVTRLTTLTTTDVGIPDESHVSEKTDKGDI